MLDEIYPVQFVEGINHFEEFIDDQFIKTTGFSRVAIQFIPKLSYSLNAIEVFMVVEYQSHRESSFEVAVCPDFHDHPGNIQITEGTWVASEQQLAWQTMSFQKPVVVINSKKYWLTINLDSRRIGLVIAKQGDETPLRVAGAQRWRAEDSLKPQRFMLRFYGRILPLSVS